MVPQKMNFQGIESLYVGAAVSTLHADKPSFGTVLAFNSLPPFLRLAGTGWIGYYTTQRVVTRVTVTKISGTAAQGIHVLKLVSDCDAYTGRQCECEFASAVKANR
jgi:hypothetical protein